MLYSPIEHLAKTIALSRFDWKEIRFGMFTACFDASGSQHDQDFMVVAGFVSTADCWIEFDALWKARLAADGLSYFHMVEFAQSSEQFKKGWRDNEPRRRRLLSDLMDIICRYAFRRFGCAIQNPVFKASTTEEERERHFLNAYSMAAITCAAQVANWHEKNNGLAVNLVFEDGDLGKGDLMTLLKADFRSVPSFRPKRDRPTALGINPAFTPLQAADFYAYEGLLGCKNFIDPKRDSRWGLNEFYKIPGVLAFYTRENFEQLIELVRVYENTARWWTER